MRIREETYLGWVPAFTPRVLSHAISYAMQSFLKNQFSLGKTLFLTKAGTNDYLAISIVQKPGEAVILHRLFREISQCCLISNRIHADEYASI